MNIPQLKYLVRETIKEVKGNSPTQTPTKPGVKEPGTKTDDKPKKRRPLTPPKEAPNTNPKAEVNENEKQVVNNIVKRFKAQA